MKAICQFCKQFEWTIVPLLTTTKNMWQTSINWLCSSTQELPIMHQFEWTIVPPFTKVKKCDSLQSIDCVEALKNNYNDCYLTVSMFQLLISIWINSNCWWCTTNQIVTEIKTIPGKFAVGYCMMPICWSDRTKQGQCAPSRRQQLLQMRSCWTFLRS